MKKVYGLIIMDGFGLSEDETGNAIRREGIPNIKRLINTYPNSVLSASGRDVGLPTGQMGNSEVGHLNIGAGRVVVQDITMIDMAIEDGGFYKNPALVSSCENAKKNKSKLHLIGLMSDGGVHSHISHVFALLNLAKQYGIADIYVHCLMDGRDTSPTSGADYIGSLAKYMRDNDVGKIGSVVGRYYLMDRDNRWERVEKGFNCITAGIGAQSGDPVSALRAMYKEGITDEFATPTCITEGGIYKGTVDAGDSVIFFNFRSDRAREVTRAFIYRGFKEFERAKGYTTVHYTGMTQYDATFTGIHTAFQPKDLKNTLGEYLAKSGKTQLRIAETEKYAHVTFFFNGGVEQPNENERRILVNSPKVATYDLLPQMSAYEVTDKAIAAVNSGEIDVMILNFANCDMVGHTGNIEAAVSAVEAVDTCVGRLADLFVQIGGELLITADHGNAEQLIYPDGSVCTAHTTNPVPLIYVGNAYESISDGRLCDIAPTLLRLMNLPIPKEMEGKPLVK